MPSKKPSDTASPVRGGRKSHNSTTFIDYTSPCGVATKGHRIVTDTIIYSVELHTIMAETRFIEQRLMPVQD